MMATNQIESSRATKKQDHNPVTLTTFRPYEAHPVITRPQGNKTIEINPSSNKITFQKTPPPLRKVIPRDPSPGKKTPRVQNLQPQSSTTSLSEVSAVGTTTSQPHRPIAQLDSIINSKKSLSESNEKKDHWMPDNKCHQCSDCETRFTIFVRRHHCRVCGRIFCHSCSNHTIPGHLFRPSLSGNIRVCRACERLFYEVNATRQTQNTPALISLQTPLKGRSGSFSSTTEQLSSLDVGDNILLSSTATYTSSKVPSLVSWDEISDPETCILGSPARTSSTGIEFDNPTPRRHPTIRKRSLPAENEENILALAEDEVELRLQEIWHKFLDKNIGLPPKTNRYRFRTISNSYSAHDIVEWLLCSNQAHSREMAVRIGQALIHTKCLKVVSSNDQIFKDLKDVILEIGEAGQLTAHSSSPTVADAPNWFLSDDGEDTPTNGYNQRNIPHEANVDLEGEFVSFHCNQTLDTKEAANEGKGKGTIKEVPSNIPLIIEEIVGEEVKDVEESCTLPYLPANKDKSGANVFTPGSYIIPPPSSMLAIPVDPSHNAGIISYSILDADAVNHAIPIAGLSKASEAARQFEESSIQTEIKRLHLINHEKHFDAFLKQQLETFGLSYGWLDIIKPLIVDACHKVRTDVTSDDFMDIRFYCKIKKIPGGRKSACSFVHGVVFSKHVTHKKMDLSIRNPRILLLKCAFEFQRKENQLSSFDVLMSQEHEYLKNLVERVKKFRPSIIFVQKSVSRFALEMLHSHGIVVVVNIKPSVMARIARSTQSDLLISLDQLYFDVNLGTCGHFHVRPYTLPDGVRKTLMYLDDCDPKLGGVILLQGSTNNVLKRVKKVVSFGLLVAHNMILESSFLADVFATPTHPMQDYKGRDCIVTPPSTPQLSLYCFSPSILDEEAILKLEKDDRLSPDNTFDTEQLVESNEVGGIVGVVAEDDIVNEETMISTSNAGDSDYEEFDEVHVKLPKKPTSPEEVFQTILSSHFISTSPYMSFTIPYLETDTGSKADIRQYLPKIIYWSHWFQSKSTENVTTPTSRSRTHSTRKVSDFDSSIRHNYKSVSSHPFTMATFLNPANCNEYKAALADFRARASLSDEPNCFFFPAAKEGTNVYQQLKEIFETSSEFEMRASEERVVNIDEMESKEESNQLENGAMNQRAKHWMIPKNGSYPSLLQSSSYLSCGNKWMTVQGDDLTNPFVTSVDPGLEPHHGLSMLFECGQSPEPTVLAVPREEAERIIPSGEWSVLMDENILPNAEQLDCLDPFNHQFLSLVFSSTCQVDQVRKQLYPCVLPCIIPMNYYGLNDISLGEFLHRYCFRDTYSCQSCTIDMDKHQRHFVHGRLKIRISMQQLAASIPGGDSNIFTWSTCLKCAHSTPLTSLSNESLLFSFAKFLELKFYGTNYVAYKFEEGESKEEDVSSCCNHPINGCYAQYFCYGNKVTTFEPISINLLEVRIPPREVSIDNDLIVWHHNYPREINHLGKLVEGMFCRIIQYFNLYNLEPVQAKVQDSLARSHAMRETFRNKLKKLKDLSVDSRLFPGPWNNCSVDVKEKVFELQDSIADFKRHIADTVFCFNLELEDVDNKLRDCLTRKESSPRESAGNTPLTITLEDCTPSGTPNDSPILRHKNIKRSPTLLKKTSHVTTPPTPTTWLSHSIEYGNEMMRRRGHKRQLSDSIALSSTREERSDMAGAEEEPLKRRRNSLGKIGAALEMHPSLSANDIDSVKNDNLDLRYRSQTDTCVQTEETSERGGELIQTIRDGVQSDHMLSVLHSEDIDLLAKLRGKEVEDSSKFYQIQTTPVKLAFPEQLEPITESKATKSPSQKRNHTTPNGKGEESTDFGVLKSAEKRQYPDKLTALLSKPFQKLPPPFNLTEHHLLRGSLRFHVSVYENEPTSIIAFALCSREYANELKLLLEERNKGLLTESTSSVQPKIILDGELSVPGPPATKQSGLKQLKNTLSDWVKNRHTSNTSSLPATSSDEQLPVDNSEQLTEASSMKSENDLFASIKWNSAPDSSSRFSSSHENRHISLEFADDTTKFFCKMYYAEEFRKLRELIYPDGEDSFIRCLARCVKYEAKGGKSRAMFLKTFEDRLIMKQVQMVEITSFIETALQYFQHVSEAIKNERPLVLAKILGAYSIGFRNNKTGRSKRHHVIIMENLLYGHNCTKVFDLKGSMRGRYVTQNPKKPKQGDVLMDENYLEYIYDTPVYVWPHSKAVMMQSILADTQFLAANSIMDYSLLTALDEEKGELVVGIIDFVRPFTLDKLFEMFIKKAGRSVLPTVVYPEMYRKRFIEAMDRYFTPVPDKWTGLGADIKINLSL